MADIKIDSRYLEGIMWNDSIASMPKEKDTEGKKKIKYERVSRKLLVSDVLAVKEGLTEVIFVTSDGKKYTKPKLSSISK